MQPEACECQPPKVSIKGKQCCVKFERQSREQRAHRGKSHTARPRLTKDPSRCRLPPRPATLEQFPCTRG
jgi:hypothetical protein